MSGPRERSIDAAGRILASHARGAPLSTLRVELAAWLVGSGGGTPPRLADPQADLQARLAALLGAGNHGAAEAFLLEHVPTRPGERLLFSACMLAGHLMADTLVDLAHRLHTGWFLGSMLTHTTRPDRLLTLLHGDQRHRVRTICELVVAGRDGGAPSVAAEASWTEIAVEPHWNWSDMQEYCNGAVRIKVREDLEEAIHLLETFERPEKPGQLFEGAFALFARLVRIDAPRAALLAADAVTPQDRVIRLQGMAWGLELPAVALPLVKSLLSETDSYVALALLRILTACRQTEWLDCARANVANHPPLEIADSLALGVHSLRLAGRENTAEEMREHVLARLPADGGSGQISSRDLFDVISAPGRPTTTPWRTPPGFSRPCP